MATLEKTIGQIVADDFRAASVFKKYGIDFCCKGNRSIEDACEAKKINPNEVYRDLEHIGNASTGTSDFGSWPLDLLADYVEKVHHAYIREKSPVLLQFLHKIARVHGERHPELVEVYHLFEDSVQDLAVHLEKEEQILFPFIRTITDAEKAGNPLPNVHFGTVANPVQMMMGDHEAEGARFEKISLLTNGYLTPEDGCSTYNVAFRMLEDFENDLHKHIHIENNILFPRAIALEKQIRS